MSSSASRRGCRAKGCAELSARPPPTRRSSREPDRSPDDVERDVLAAFDLEAVAVTGQTYPRKLDYLVLSAIAGFAASCSKFAFDVRVLASSPFGELGEPFGRKQVGSSAMPFKRNPMLCERINSMARIPAAHAQIAWQNAADNLLERTLDDSANRRTIIPGIIPRRRRAGGARAQGDHAACGSTKR